MYITIKTSIHNNDVQEYVEMLDEQDREIRALKEYRRIQEELFTIFSEGDEELQLISNIEKARDKYNLKDAQLYKVFNLTRDKLNWLKKSTSLPVHLSLVAKVCVIAVGLP